ncbi:unnamed protein product [Amoebophrya sp. A120]|nr:unnamed protein product [Amoebophrya sp. A120]|eukprot:GSA120T00013172001.1
MCTTTHRSWTKPEKMIDKRGVPRNRKTPSNSTTTWMPRFSTYAKGAAPLLAPSHDKIRSLTPPASFSGGTRRSFTRDPTPRCTTNPTWVVAPRGDGVEAGAGV